MDIKDILIDLENTMIEAMAALDRTSKKVLFVEQNGILAAAITDGDIRRWILKKGNLDAKVKDIANFNPKFLYEKDKAIAKEYMLKAVVEALPIVDENKRILNVVLLNNDGIEPKKELNIPVIIMAGGFGTRLHPYTKILPKPLIPIGEIPIAEHIINRFHHYSCKDFFLIVNHKKNMIKAYFTEISRDYEITFIDEDKPLGTGGGLSLLKGRINTTFILSNCDIIIEEDYEKMYQYHKKENNLITMICSLKNIKIPYGVIEIGQNGAIESMKEKPELSFFTNTGCYIVEPRVIEELEEDKAIGFPTIIERYKNAGEKIGVYPISENTWMDMGQLDELEEMRKRLNCDE
ncbi:sugar phosphate nucleotidyltransferase [Sporomusa malonica]|uniref:Nucleotidyl transferase n=1 Tax=Sporomusa malonica TaxID=112901 RepID=A0A1W1YUK6_9FIRM|nr:sugar phosphate nucleotidyltransferase [Sporomusa malonica]SMC39398.1 Nucleotidyl transferase [Sporomusa malonica]